jgi:hypothetical protein
MPEPHLRAADTDRAAVAAELGEHMSAGRLTLAEYDERVTSAYAATTFGDLAALTSDLPPLGRAPVPASATREVAHAPAHGPGWHGRRHHDHSFHAWLRVSLIVLAIWLMTSLSAGTLLPFWPMWVIGPWGAVLLSRRIGSGPRRHSHPADA